MTSWIETSWTDRGRPETVATIATAFVLEIPAVATLWHQFVRWHLADGVVDVTDPTTLLTYLTDLYLEIDAIGMAPTLIAWGGIGVVAVVFARELAAALALILLGPLHFGGEIVGPGGHVHWRQLAAGIAGSWVWFTVGMVVIGPW